MRAIFPKIFIDELSGDSFYVIRAFQKELSICYNIDQKLSKVKTSLLSKVLQHFEHYTKFSRDGIYLLTELYKVLVDPLSYYNTETVGLLLIAEIINDELTICAAQ